MIASPKDIIVLPSYSMELKTVSALTTPMLVFPSRGGFQNIEEDAQAMLQETVKVGVAMIQDFWRNPVNKAKTVLMVGSCVAVPFTDGLTAPVCLGLVGSVASDLISSDLKLLAYKIIDATNYSLSTKLFLKNMLDLTSVGISVTTLDPAEGIISDIDALGSEVDFLNNTSSQIFYDQGVVRGASISVQKKGSNEVYLFTIYNRDSSSQPSVTKSKDPDCKTSNTGDYSFQNNTKFDLRVTLNSAPGKISGRSENFTCTLQPGQRQSFFGVPAGAARYTIRTTGTLSAYGSASPYKSIYADGSVYVDACNENTFIINIDKPSYSTNIPAQTDEKNTQPSKAPNCKESNTGDYSFQNNTKFDLRVTLNSAPGKISGRNENFTCTLQPGQRQSFFDVPAGAARYTIRTTGTLSAYGSASPYKSIYADGSVYVDACNENTFIINIDKPSYSTNIPAQTDEKNTQPSKAPNCKESNTGDYSFQNNTKFDLRVTLNSAPDKISGRNENFTCTLQPGQRQSFFDVPAGAARYTIRTTGTLSAYGSAIKNYYANGSLSVDACMERSFIIK